MNTRRTRHRDVVSNPSQLVVLTKALDLLKYTFTVTSNDKNIPKKFRLTMVRQMQDTMLSAYSDLIHANLIFPQNQKDLHRRLQFNQFADESLHILLALAEASTQVCHFRNPGNWSKLIWEVIKLNRAWATATKEQFAELPE